MFLGDAAHYIVDCPCSWSCGYSLAVGLFGMGFGNEVAAEYSSSLRAMTKRGE